MARPELIRMIWDGGALVPDGNAATAALHDHLGAGEVLYVDIDPERSKRSHGHQFAFVRRAWATLPEHLTGQPWAATPDTLRKYALIRTGYCKTELVAVGSAERALRVVSAMKAALRADEDEGFSVVEASGPVVMIFRPETQKLRAMGHDRFQESKQAIGEWLAALLGVPVEEMMRVEK